MKLPLEEHLFVSIRLRYLSVAAQGITGFLVDGKNTAYIISLPGLEQAAWVDLIGKFDDANGAVGGLTGDCGDCHDLCVAVYASMKSAYRKDVESSQRIRKLPKEDRTPARTLVRMLAINKIWPTLPNVPGTAAPLVVGGVDADMFDTKTEAFVDKVTAADLASGQYSGAAALFQMKLKDWDTFVSAALLQNRPLYKPGTPERTLLDRIPTAPATQAPDQAVITVAESSARGESHLLFGAEHGTSFEVWEKGPGDAEFAQVADVLLPGEYSASGLAGGDHEYKIVPVNSQGKGPASAVVVVSVIALGAPGVPSVSPPELLAPGEVNFQMQADAAAEFEVWEKGPGESVYTLAVTLPSSVAGEGEYSASSQPPGVHWYKVRAMNAEGAGPFSAPVSLDVLEAAA